MPLRISRVDSAADMAVNRGKIYEGEIAKAFRDWPTTPFVLRIKDGSEHKGASTRNPADILVCSQTLNFLIECKAEKTKSIEFKRVKAHQRQALVAFSRIGPKHLGFVAILFYNGKLGKAREYRCWLVEAVTWQTVHKRARRGRMGNGRKRKSLPVAWLLDGTVPAIEVPWVPGKGWDMEPALGPLARGDLRLSRVK